MVALGTSLSAKWRVPLARVAGRSSAAPSGKTRLKQATRKVRFFLYALSSAGRSWFWRAVCLVWLGGRRDRIVAGRVIRCEGHAVKGGEAGPEAVRIPQGARVGFEVADACRGHEQLNALETLFGLAVSVTGLLVWHV